MQKLDSIKWDDFNLVLQIARAKGLPGAAKATKRTISTLSRRLDQLEESLGCKLFERLRGSYQLTQTGHVFFSAGENMEQHYHQALRQVEGTDSSTSGSIRLTSTDALARCFLAKHLPVLMVNHPELSIELLTGDKELNLISREADVSLRPKKPIEGYLVGRRLSLLPWSFYMSMHNSVSEPHAKLNHMLTRSPFYTWSGTPIANATEELFDLADYVVEVRVSEGSGIIGKKVRDLDDVADKSDVEINMMRTIKQALDPKNIMNPGKVIRL